VGRSRVYVSDWEEPRADYYRIDVNSGARTPMHGGADAHARLSPDGRRYLYWKDDHVWSYELAADRHVNLTARAPVSFVNAEWDYLSTAPPYGVAGWTKDGRGVILMHRYDLWLVPLDGGAARNLTNGVGSEHEIRLRYVQLDPEERFIDLSRPLLLSAFGQWTKQAGFYELRGGRIRQLVLTDNMYGGRRRRATRTACCSRGRAGRVPGPAGRAHSTSRSRSHDGRESAAGGVRVGTSHPVRLHEPRRRPAAGHARDPGGWQPGQRLPMLVNFYEKYSQNLHLYPCRGTAPGRSSRAT
jgi:hypothetical protein